ncbi:MAG TPA: hypothetical protein VNI02_04475 [Blastocatellia bacterium]|jgi:hypothetical protein|nr:hypothetical protein [Blastocatellia bacterium]
MRAKTHPGDEQKVKTSSDHATTDSENMGQSDGRARGKAERELKQTGLTVDDVAQQSAYESDEPDITQTAANSDRNKKG